VQLVEVGNQRPAISPDNVLGARLAVEHLLNLGHRRIAFLAMKPGSPALRQRMQGYREALTAAGIAMRPELVEELIDPCEEAGAEGMTRLLARENFTGLVCYNDLVAMGAMDVARAAGIRVPEDLSVVGFDDVSEAYHYEVPLTTLRFDRMHMGRRAVELVYEIRSGLVDESGFDAFTADEIVPGSEILPVELVVRGSTGPAPLN